MLQFFRGDVEQAYMPSPNFHLATRTARAKNWFDLHLGTQAESSDRFCTIHLNNLAITSSDYSEN